jgi:hypothetical protein
MAKKIAKNRSAYFAVWEAQAGGKRIAELAFGQDNPQQNIEDSFGKARYWFRNNWLVQNIILLRYVFFNFGFKIKAIDKADQPKVDVWLARRMPGVKKKITIEQELKRYGRDAWLELLTLQNVIGVWAEEGRPLVFPAEDCEFTDVFGAEVLTIETNLTRETIGRMKGLSAAEKDALLNVNATGKLKLTHGNGAFSFDVVKREKIGKGLSWPGLATIFTTCAQNESLEVGDAVMAHMMRRVYELHKKGHEIKSGPHAGFSTHFLKPDYAKKTESNIKGKVGHVAMCVNFDHTVDFPRPDPKHFDAKRYASAIERIKLWGLPLAQMILDRALNPYQMDILKAQALGEREMMKDHLERIASECLKAPVPVAITWSNRCFRDSRLAADLLKYGMQWGPLSQTTFLDETGYDAETERENKDKESKLPKAQVEPLVDANHGKDQKPAGKKRGTADGQGK